MIIFINNEPRELTTPSTLHDMLVVCDMASARGLAIAVNNQVIARATWEKHLLKAGDKITLIRASKGG